jgi:hypothetical protein
MMSTEAATHVRATIPDRTSAATTIASWTLPAVLLLVACGASPRVVPTESPAPEPVAAVPYEPVVPHPDYLALRPFRTYFRLVRVGELTHHFRVWYHHAETAHALYEVSSSAPDAPRRTHDSFGFFTEPGIEDVPPERREMAEAIRRDLRALEPGASSFVVVYLGEYRDIEIEEILARPSREGTSGRHHTATLAADGALTRISGRAAAVIDGGGSLFLERGPVPEHRAEAPVWIDAVPDRPGTPRLWTMIGEIGDPAPRDALYAAVLDAARRSEAGEPGPPLDSLAVQRDPDVLPAGVEDGIGLSCYANLWRAHETLSSSFQASLDIGDEAEGSVAVGSSSVECRLALRLREELPEDASGPRELELEIAWSIGHRFERRSGVTHLRVSAIVDRGRVAILDFLSSDAGDDAQVLRTSIGGDRMEARVGLFRQD